MPSINSARYAPRIIQTESHESPSFLRKVHRLDPPAGHQIFNCEGVSYYEEDLSIIAHHIYDNDGRTMQIEVCNNCRCDEVKMVTNYSDIGIP